ncbi:Molybdenum cofactor guanylyltransferase [Pseudovibrio axinellae]|uniref:Molybdenum cofactor guanylyltransferase n=1 Tax=Pseudovibrio axinellae TaxID=989403 RepID=A0A165TZ12_9HYPH|nr:molybdenum cofactor guanylyltransferase MobA [Pseudovibrio axinellae]KZL08494.1 Molybdenum cofactor guanylyltransferase [Pseudovibrio axinellae]SEP76125.1 molybdenum cofactor guanylyltransferase [Pseudovibrio axinellae]
MAAARNEKDKVIGCILSGGKSRRMGHSDKSLVTLGKATLLEHVVSRLRHQVQQLVVSVNDPGDAYERLDLPLLKDQLAGHLGPLAGIHAALSWAKLHSPHATDVASIAVDTPFFPTNLVETLMLARVTNPEPPVICSSAGRSHFAFGLWPITLADPLKDYLLNGGRSIKGFFNEHAPVIVNFESQNTIDPFFNINTPEDIPLALEYLSQLHVQ